MRNQVYLQHKYAVYGMDNFLYYIVSKGMMLINIDQYYGLSYYEICKSKR